MRDGMKVLGGCVLEKLVGFWSVAHDQKIECWLPVLCSSFIQWEGIFPPLSRRLSLVESDLFGNRDTSWLEHTEHCFGLDVKANGVSVLVSLGESANSRWCISFWYVVHVDHCSPSSLPYYWTSENSVYLDLLWDEYAQCFFSVRSVTCIKF